MVSEFARVGVDARDKQKKAEAAFPRPRSATEPSVLNEVQDGGAAKVARPIKKGRWHCLLGRDTGQF